MTPRSLRTFAAAALFCGVAGAAMTPSLTQGRSAPDWTTAGADAQRSGWVPVDPWLSIESMRDFRFLWKLRLDNEARQQSALSTPVSMANLNTYKGFKSLVFVGGSSNNVYAVDYDFGTLFWTTHFTYSSGVPEFSGSAACPGGMVAELTRSTNLIPQSQLAFMGFARPPRPAKGAVGEPGKGAAGLTPEIANRGGRAGRGAATPAPAPPPAAAAPPPARGRSTNWVFALPADGLVRALNPITGELVGAPAKFVPPNAYASGLIQTDGVLYGITSNGCGGAPDAIWAMDLQGDDKHVVSWSADGGSISAPAFAQDGTIYLTVGEGPSKYAGSVVALDGKTLVLKDWFTPSVTPRFGTSPVVFSEGDRPYVAAASADGRLFLLAAGALGGGDHKTPTAVATVGGKELASLTTWRDASGVRWLMAATGPSGQAGAVVGFRLLARDAVPMLQQGWARDLSFVRSPVVVNGVAFALSSGKSQGPNAVLYALDAATGKDIWNSGSTITSFATGGLATGTGQVYVVTYDNTLWAFGIPQSY